jgi:hypothetical protein
MKCHEQPLDIEITLPSGKSRRSGRSRKPGLPSVPDAPRIPRIARLMALAIKFQDMVDSGDLHDYADIARLGFVTRARLTQIMNLRLLAPDVQEQILFMNGPERQCRTFSERKLRSLVCVAEWDDQRSRFKRLQDV